MDFVLKILMLIMLICANAVADQDDKPTLKLPDYIPQMIINDGNIDIVFDASGKRVARLKKSKATQFKYSVDAEIIENTCSSDFMRNSCSYNVSFIPEFISFVWIKHEDSAKKGKVLFGSDGEILNLNDNLWSWESMHDGETFGNFVTPLTSSYTKNLEGPELICENDFIDTIPNNNEQVLINEWTAEDNTENPETGLSENMIAVSYMDIEAKIINNRSLKFQKIGYVPRVQDRNATVSFSLGDVLGWSIRREDKKMCEVSIKSDKGSFLSFLVSLFTRTDSFEYEDFNNFKEIDEIGSYIDPEEFDGYETDEFTRFFSAEDVGGEDAYSNIMRLLSFGILGFEEIEYKKEYELTYEED